ncbi:MAG TPA: DUF6498-containing protein [Candidatus Saccharimonadales bacterium]
MPLLTFILQIVIYSVLPLLGVLFLGWDWKQILILFWLENITVGLMAIVAMARTNDALAGTVSLNKASRIRLNGAAAKVTGIAFFVLHYGMFTFIDGIFVFALTSGVLMTLNLSHAELPIGILALLGMWATASVVKIAAAFIQPAPTNPIEQQMFNPYKRIIPLHIAIVLGAFAMILLGLPSIAVIVLIVIKLIFDIKNYGSELVTQNSIQV